MDFMSNSSTYQSYVRTRESLYQRLMDLFLEHFDEEVESCAQLFWSNPFLSDGEMDALLEVEECQAHLEALLTLFLVFAFPLENGQPFWKFAQTQYPDQLSASDQALLRKWEGAVYSFFRIESTQKESGIVEIRDLFDGRAYQLVDFPIAIDGVRHDALGLVIFPSDGMYWVVIGMQAPFSPRESDLILKLLQSSFDAYRQKEPSAPDSIQVFLAQKPIFFCWIEMVVLWLRVMQEEGAADADVDLPELDLDALSGNEDMRDNLLQSVYEEYMSNWISEPREELDGQSPKAAYRTPEGREKVLRIIQDMHHYLLETKQQTILQFFSEDELIARLEAAG